MIAAVEFQLWMNVSGDDILEESDQTDAIYKSESDGNSTFFDKRFSA
jgi:hypothetical protein